MTILKPFILSLFISLCTGQTVLADVLKPCAKASYIRPEQPMPSSGDADPAWLQPAPTNKTGCVRGLRMLAGPNLAIWRCQVVLPDGQEFADGQTEFAFLIQQKDTLMQEHNDELMAGAYHNFEVVKVDLDNDGQGENILAAWNGQSNGLGVHSWTVHVFDKQWTLIRRFNDVVDWGDSSLVAASAGRNGCDIAITSYVEDASLRGRTGLALSAQFYSYSLQRRGDAVAIAPDRSALLRRLSNSFLRQRTAWFSAGDGVGEASNTGRIRGDVAGWLNHSSTRRVPN